MTELSQLYWLCDQSLILPLVWANFSLHFYFWNSSDINAASHLWELETVSLGIKASVASSWPPFITCNVWECVNISLHTPPSSLIMHSYPMSLTYLSFACSLTLLIIHMWLQGHVKCQSNFSVYVTYISEGL